MYEYSVRTRLPSAWPSSNTALDAPLFPCLSPSSIVHLPSAIVVPTMASRWPSLSPCGVTLGRGVSTRRATSPNSVAAGDGDWQPRAAQGRGRDWMKLGQEGDPGRSWADPGPCMPDQRGGCSQPRRDGHSRVLPVGSVAAARAEKYLGRTSDYLRSTSGAVMTSDDC